MAKVINPPPPKSDPGFDNWLYHFWELLGSVSGSINLTGPITATAGVTSVTSQTGTGTKFVMDTSPTLVTPNVGAATASSVTINGTTGTKGPIYITRNPTSTAAGEALGLRINISSNDNNSPGANDYVGIENRVTNDGRLSANLWSANFTTQQGGGATGNVQARVLEVELSSDTSSGTLQTDPFSGTNLRSNGIEINAISGSSTLTCGLTLWSNNLGSAGWWNTGLAISRVVSTGISFRKLTGDAAEPFSTAILDLSTLAAAPQVFTLGHAASDTELQFKNSADHVMGLTIDSGTSAAQESRLDFADRGTAKWRLVKDSSNQFIVYDNAAGASAITCKTGGLVGVGIAPTYRLEIVGGAGSGVPALLVRPDNNAGINFAVQRAGDGSGTASVGTSTNHNLRLMTNNTDRWTIDTSGNVVPGSAALATTATNGFTYIQSCAGAPTGVPATYTGRVPLVYDSTNNKLYAYNGAWKSVALA